MAGSVFDSQLYGDLFPAGDAARLFSDSAEIRAMLLVEGALAKAQGAAGVIPADSAAAIDYHHHRQHDLDRLADTIDQHLDTDALLGLLDLP